MADIYQISWVTPDNFDPDKVSVQPTTSSGTYDRSKIMYQYTPKGPKKDLIFTVPRDPDAYMTCNGVQKDVFTKGDQKIETNRYGAQFVLESSNDYHVALFNAFEKLVEKLADLTGAEINVPSKESGENTILYTNLIHANDGRMFSSAYTDDKQIDIISCKQSIVRPALLLSTLKKSKTEVKLTIQVSQMYIHKELMNFPLANRD